MDVKAAVTDYLAAGGRLTEPDTILAAFDPLALAQALETELARAAVRGQTHLRLTLAARDAAALARCLRGAARRGG